jgi:hypothetical protein
MYVVGMNTPFLTRMRSPLEGLPLRRSSAGNDSGLVDPPR